jgi:hypothetical protein
LSLSPRHTMTVRGRSAGQASSSAPVDARAHRSTKAARMRAHSAGRLCKMRCGPSTSTVSASGRAARTSSTAVLPTSLSRVPPEIEQRLRERPTRGPHIHTQDFSHAMHEHAGRNRQHGGARFVDERARCAVAEQSGPQHEARWRHMKEFLSRDDAPNARQPDGCAQERRHETDADEAARRPTSDVDGERSRERFSDEHEGPVVG